MKHLIENNNLIKFDYADNIKETTLFISEGVKKIKANADDGVVLGNIKIVLLSTLEDIEENALLFFQDKEKLRDVLIKFYYRSCVEKFVLDNFIKFEKLMY